MQKPPVMVLCGGLGSRLQEETESKPKPMIEIGGRPILWHIMKIYSAQGFKDFILCLGYKGHLIKDFFLNYRAYQSDLIVDLGIGKPDPPHNLQFVSDHPEDENWTVTLVETGANAQTGARVRKAARYLDKASRFCLTYGDGLADIDLEALLDCHEKHGRIGTVTGVRPPGRFGELEVDKNGLATQFNEKPQLEEGWINGGFFVFEKEFVEKYLPNRDDLVLEQEPLQKLTRDNQLTVYEHRGFWQPMDTYREFKFLNDLWATGEPPWVRKNQMIRKIQ
ncbi:MAG: glucose-1-phosphate cytidylyltransferase [Candidatus Omnitrophica bacterium]|nr:glucose-1-phosphate cytidylyltransferase [Candidatus Omnitrophota bacterium]